MNHFFSAPHPLDVCVAAAGAALDGAAMVSPDGLADVGFTSRIRVKTALSVVGPSLESITVSGVIR